MTTFIAFGNIQQHYPLRQIPPEFLTEELGRKPTENIRVKRRHRSRWIAHFLLWELCKKAQIPTALLADIQRSVSGRPYFTPPHIDFNISHSGDWVAVILSVNTPQSIVGIDIEHPKKMRNYTALLAHFASQREQNWFAGEADADSAFYRCWCLREAILKSQGVGIVQLSEVFHDPQNLRLQSAYCPSGRLIFTDELPFYFACFAANSQLEQAQYFCWENNGFSPVSLNNAIKYSVNKT
ncbi:4'-phosphopantetheinyl transferase family protein [[Mannheimia] succiniciproducens]|uniref:Sfp protein n=1 Tax=Mannheimia succiniciproducens (strain KCTC 0769BP / MBEL55E) TaxID=221988 RepID=Q65RV8_MANSM|nr:4'-phosphopantetheinyl transferase superfamily protein [[Mannheimia] succiniciproducens]AAU38302.1 Sfp protein [[Mannheimia] succiniciproducens MBEL55E]